MYNKKFIYEYWERTELGREMIASESVSESDLLFLIPNNVKRMHGLPVTRNHTKKKKKSKEQRKRFILSFRLFDLISEVIDRQICSEWRDSEFFNEFVDVKNLTVGDQDNFILNQDKIVLIPTNQRKPIKLVFEKE